LDKISGKGGGIHEICYSFEYATIKATFTTFIKTIIKLISILAGKNPLLLTGSISGNIKKQHFILQKVGGNRTMKNKFLMLLAASTAAAAFLTAQTPKTEAATEMIEPYRQPIGSHQYVIQRGDTLFKICNLFHISKSDFLKANPALQQDGGNKIIANTTLVLPQEESMSGYEKQVLDLTNAERAKAGLQPLMGNYTELNKSARIKAEDMSHNNYFSHTSPTLGDPFQQMRAMGVTYSAAGENIAKGQQTPQEVVNAWMNSAGHRANILNGAYTHMGVGYEGSNKCWVQQFAAK
jgi:uncharacterized YkwD family protein